MTEEYADVGATQLQLAMKSVSMGNKVALTSLSKACDSEARFESCYQLHFKRNPSRKLPFLEKSTKYSLLSVSK